MWRDLKSKIVMVYNELINQEMFFFVGRTLRDRGGGDGFKYRRTREEGDGSLGYPVRVQGIV